MLELHHTHQQVNQMDHFLPQLSGRQIKQKRTLFRILCHCGTLSNFLKNVAVAFVQHFAHCKEQRGQHIPFLSLNERRHQSIEAGETHLGRVQLQEARNGNKKTNKRFVMSDTNKDILHISHTIRIYLNSNQTYWTALPQFPVLMSLTRKPLTASGPTGRLLRKGNTRKAPNVKAARAFAVTEMAQKERN